SVLATYFNQYTTLANRKSIFWILASIKQEALNASKIVIVTSFKHFAARGSVNLIFDYAQRKGRNLRGKSMAIANQKGGVGRTTTSINREARSAVVEYKTWCVDADGQA